MSDRRVHLYHYSTFSCDRARKLHEATLKKKHVFIKLGLCLFLLKQSINEYAECHKRLWGHAYQGLRSFVSIRRVRNLQRM